MLIGTSQSLVKLCHQMKLGFAFKKFDYEDPLNLKTLLS